ncbi:hypothetical protein HK101_002158 [Irineochytrium annulatum]|nr:hypothetical protein HK101_002158 [Irineochytrium annulatum]
MTSRIAALPYVLLSLLPFLLPPSTTANPQTLNPINPVVSNAVPVAATPAAAAAPSGNVLTSALCAANVVLSCGEVASSSSTCFTGLQTNVASPMAAGISAVSLVSCLCGTLQSQAVVQNTNACSSCATATDPTTSIATAIAPMLNMAIGGSLTPATALLSLGQNEIAHVLTQFSGMTAACNVLSQAGPLGKLESVAGAASAGAGILGGGPTLAPEQAAAVMKVLGSTKVVYMVDNQTVEPQIQTASSSDASVGVWRVWAGMLAALAAVVMFLN